MKNKGPRVLILDIETFPLEVFSWGIWDQNISVNQIQKDWTIASWAAKYLDQKEVMYQDVRKEKNVRNDKKLLRGIHKLLCNIDILVTQNGIDFDLKKLNARFFFHKMKPIGNFRHLDIKRIAKKNFGFTSNSLEYMSTTFNRVYKKLDHKKFPGMELWKECLKGNLAAWNEMETYNKHDVLATEELYNKMRFWDASCDTGIYYAMEPICNECGSKNVRKWDISNNKQRYWCKNCKHKFTADSQKDMETRALKLSKLKLGRCYACGSTKFLQGKIAYTKTNKFFTYLCRNKKCGVTIRDSKGLITAKMRSYLLRRV